MERDFASTIGSNPNTSHYPPSPAANLTADFNMNYSIFNDPNLQPLLSLPSDPSIFNLFGQPQDFPSLPLEPLPPLQVDSLYSSTPPQIPHILPDDSTHFLDFFSKPLPDLHSLEQPPLPLPLLRCQPRHTDSSSSSSSSARKLKRTRLDLNLSDNNDPQTLNSIIQSFDAPPPRVPPHSKIARTRRQKLSRSDWELGDGEQADQMGKSEMERKQIRWGSRSRWRGSNLCWGSRRWRGSKKSEMES